MREARSEHENAYVMARLRPVLTRLQSDTALMLEFLAFAAERGRLDPVKFAVRLNNTTGQMRPPSTFTALVLLEFGVEKGLLEPTKNGGSRRR